MPLSSIMLLHRRSRETPPRASACFKRSSLLLVMLLAAGMPAARAQLSKGIVGDHSIVKEGNKFLKRNAHEDTAAPAPK